MPGRDPLPATPVVPGASATTSPPKGKISRFPNTNLSFFIASTTAKNTQDKQVQLITDAFNRWGAVTPLNFTRTMTRTGADLVVGFGTGGHCELYVNSNLTCSADAAFEAATLGHAYFPQGPNQGQCHMNDAQNWADDRLLFSTLVHEIGHNLGLEHLPDQAAVMFASDNGQTGNLLQPDINAIQRLYGSRDGTVRPVQADTPPANDTAANRTAPTPTQVDTDGDGLDDASEIYLYGTSPILRDSDGDGVDDGVEIVAGLEADDNDTDNDGVPDGQEFDGDGNAYVPDSGLTGDASAFAGTYNGTDSIGAPLQLIVAADGAVTGKVSITEYGFAEDVELIGRAAGDGRLEVVSYDYFFNYEGSISGLIASGNFETEGDMSGTWTATKAIIKAKLPDVRPDLGSYVLPRR
jgi:hypothetical protein